MIYKNSQNWSILKFSDSDEGKEKTLIFDERANYEVILLI